ncbi:MAG: hypothetical protein NC131_14295, partial [Roseburia sp.]|nr:hypothetical protein [Roseburia sp.]
MMDKMNVKPKGLKELLEDDPTLTEKVTYEEHIKRKERLKQMCGKTDGEKLAIAMNALNAIKTRIDNCDDYLNPIILDIEKATDNALKMIGGN